jgi:hypothetical protein
MLTVVNPAALNFEVTPGFAVIINVQDNGTGKFNSPATVTVPLTNLNEAPVINNQAFSSLKTQPMEPMLELLQQRTRIPGKHSPIQYFQGIPAVLLL